MPQLELVRRGPPLGVGLPDNSLVTEKVAGRRAPIRGALGFYFGLVGAERIGFAYTTAAQRQKRFFEVRPC
jgi:hypothetical protein